MAALYWTCEGSKLYAAKCALGQHGTAQLVVEGLGEAGWDWHVWDVAGRALSRYGVATSLDQAKERAWRAAADLARQAEPTRKLEPAVQATDLVG